MPVTPTYPGVYIEEIPSGVRTIVGVATSIGAFMDFFARGPMNQAVQIFNMGDFNRVFGGLDERSEASYAIQQFFLNGGSECWVVRVASVDPNDASNTPSNAAVYINDVIVSPPLQAPPAVNTNSLTVTAIDEGRWGNGLRVKVDPNTPVQDEFNLFITEYQTMGGKTVPVRQEVFRNVSMDPAKSNFADTVVNDPNKGSKLVQVAAQVGAQLADPPLANGTIGGVPPSVPIPLPPNSVIDVTITDGVNSLQNNVPLLLVGPQSLSAVAQALEAAIRAAYPAEPAFSGASVDLIGNRLRILAGPGNPANRVLFSNTNASGPTGLTPSTANVQEYTLGSPGIDHSAQLFGVAGRDGVAPFLTELIGDLNSKTGIYAFEDVDLFNLLCVPRSVDLPDTANDKQLGPFIAVAEAYCEKRRAFFLMDTPFGIDEPQEIKNWLSTHDTLRHRNAALYYPRVRIADPLDNYRLHSRGASGTIAGLCARTDGARGVWKAPAGTEATLRNVTELDDVLTDPENGTLNPLAINCLRNFPIYGNLCWGARTLEGADQQASEWKYLPVRRLALFLEESLYRGLKWVVFEPNDEPLWAQIRLNVGAFMQNLFRQGAFQGQTPRQAYFVKCDGETTIQNDINLGIVNIVVGFAPLKPAEFVIIKIQQIAGEIQT